MKRIVLVLFVVCAGPALARADDALQQEIKKDVVLRALVDELERSRSGLKLAGFESPYLIQYSLSDRSWAYVSADLGSVTGRNQGRGRALGSDVRVGSYALDNSNFGGGTYSGGMFNTEVPIEDDYNAIRQAIWWMTDRDYKGVVEQLARKKAFMESKLIKDKPDDLYPMPPTIHCADRIDVALDVAPLEDLAVALSAVFRDFPAVQSSGASVSAFAGNEYLVNTEGTRLRSAGRQFALAVRATVQADDGMKLSDSFTACGRKFEELPPRAELLARCRKMAEQLIALKDAPLLASYTGPILLEAEPASQIFAQTFGGSFGGGQRSVGSAADPEDFANKLGKRILPRFLNVRDDPAPREIAGVPAMGHYAYDDQGVPAQTVSLVEGGRLKTLLMSRNPSKESKESNGHGRDSLAATRGSVGSLIVTADDAALDANKLRQELLEACADETLEYGIRIAALGSVGGGGRSYGQSGGANPLLTYKVYPDGHEELVRGAEIARVDLKAFKHVLAAGDKPYVRNNVSGLDGTTVVAPALLFEELDLAKVDRDFDKPPLLPTPLAREPR